jgi:beta-N-acetylhexosaminidase
MRSHLAVLPCAAALTVGLLMAPGAAGVAAGYRATDPATWSNRQLAAQLTYTCVDAAHWRTAERYAASGVGGITLLNNDASRHLASELARVRAAAPAGVRPFIGSDEEGGTVQRLRYVIYPLPSAKTMGTWSDARIEATAYRYGRHMKALGVTMDFAPVADIAVRGYYMDNLRRAFSANPYRVARAVKAWSHGMRRAGVQPVVKHWPGHGQASNSHTTAPWIPPFSTLRRRDLIPFNAAFAAHVPVVMVGHLKSRGLTDGLPASLSSHALRYLRLKAGPDTVIITDSLSMTAASSALHISPATAAVRALHAGADWALSCSSPYPIISAVRHALDTGALSRTRAVASARRIIALKRHAGLVTGR